jgi:hypothetical protein
LGVIGGGASVLKLSRTLGEYQSGVDKCVDVFIVNHRRQEARSPYACYVFVANHRSAITASNWITKGRREDPGRGPGQDPAPGTTPGPAVTQEKCIDCRSLCL